MKKLLSNIKASTAGFFKKHLNTIEITVNIISILAGITAGLLTGNPVVGVAVFGFISAIPTRGNYKESAIFAVTSGILVASLFIESAILTSIAGAITWLIICYGVGFIALPLAIAAIVYLYSSVANLFSKSDEISDDKDNVIDKQEPLVQA